jgi:uncharacterized protein YqhQ
MRGQNAAVTAVRQPNGEVTLNNDLLPSIYRGWARKTPLTRGILVLVESLLLGIKSLMFSANTALQEVEEQLSGWALWGMVAVSMAAAVAIFFVTPLLLTKLLLSQLSSSSVLFTLLEGVIRLVIFIIYLKLVALMPDIKRVFAYHGAEHKTVNAYEGGAPFEVAAVRPYSKAHIRCGTSFLLVVMVVAIFVFAFVGMLLGKSPSIWALAVSRIILVPVIAAVSYEFVYFGANHANIPFVRATMKPGLLLQSLTTREPDDSQIEVAIAALKKAVEADGPQATTNLPL